MAAQGVQGMEALRQFPFVDLDMDRAMTGRAQRDRLAAGCVQVEAGATTQPGMLAEGHQVMLRQVRHDATA